MLHKDKIPFVCIFVHQPVGERISYDPLNRNSSEVEISDFGNWDK